MVRHWLLSEPPDLHHEPHPRDLAEEMEERQVMKRGERIVVAVTATKIFDVGATLDFVGFDSISAEEVSNGFRQEQDASTVHNIMVA